VETSADDVHFPVSLTVRYMKPVVVQKLDLTR